MKKNIKYVIILAIIVVVLVGIILIIYNNKRLLYSQNEITNQSNTNVPNKSEANKMTDEQLIQKVTSGEESLNLDNIEEDKILSNIDSVLNEKDPLVDMPEK